MAIWGVSIEKTVSFRGAAQVFANVYHYNDAGGSPSDANLETLLDNLVSHEKNMHSSAVSWVRGRVWSAGGSEAANQMRVDKPLSGTGLLAHDAALDRERAVLIRWRAGQDSRGRPVYLRKWYHACASTIGGVATTAGITANTSQIGQTARDAAETTADNVLSETVAGTVFTMCGPSGRAVDGSTECHPYLEHHQLGDQWRSV